MTDSYEWKPGRTQLNGSGALTLGFTVDAATHEAVGSLAVRKLNDGSFELIAEESRKKFDGKRWSSASCFLRFSREQIAALAAHIEEAASS